MKVQAVLQPQSGALWHLVACTNPVGFKSTPPSVLEAWSQSTDFEPQRHINKIEAIVPAICLCTWPNLFRGSLWLHFIDNNGALACLVSGCSRNSSLSDVVDYTWAQIPALGCWPWFERVPSECNIVDSWSRKNFAFAFANNWYVTRRSCLNLF